MSIQFIWLLSVALLNIIAGVYYEIRPNNRFRFVIGDIPLKLKQKSIYSFLLIISLVFISINTTNIPDIEVYQLIYSGGVNSVEIGYAFLQNIFKFLNCDFYLFRAFVIITSFILFYYGLNNIGFNTQIAFSLYLFFPLEYDVIQLRNFLSFSIVLFGLHYIFYETNYGKLKYIIFVLIASSIHLMSIIYIILVFANSDIFKQKWKRQLLLLVFFITLFGSIIFKNNNYIQLLLSNIFQFVNSSKASVYLKNKVGLGYVYFWLMQLFLLVSSYFLKKGYEKTNELKIKEIKTATQLFWINILISCTLPLCILNVNFYRIFRNLLIVNYCQIGLFSGLTNNKFKTIGLFIFIIGYLYILRYNLSINTQDIINPFFGL